MPQYDGTLRFNTKIDTKGFNKDVKTVGSQMAGLTSSVGKLSGALAAAFAVKLLIDFAKQLQEVGVQALKLASDLEEVQNVVDTVFGNSSDAIDDFADTALEKFGLSELSAKRFVSTFGAIGAGVGFLNKENEQLATTLTALTGDFASFYNVSQDRAALALQSIYTGETETLKKYGIVLTEVNLQEFARQKGIESTISEMTQQQKTLLRYNFVLEATRKAQGDFIRTQANWANQTRILNEQFNELLSIIGGNLITVLTPLLQLLNQILASVISLAQGFNSLWSSITNRQVEDQGKITTSITGSSDAQEDFTDAIDGTNKALKKSIAGFDELNVLQQDTALEGATDFNLDAFTELDTAGVDQKAQEISPVIQRFIDAFDGLNDIDTRLLFASLRNLLDVLEEYDIDLFFPLENAIKFIFVPLSKLFISNTLPFYLFLLASAIDLIGGSVRRAQGLLRFFIKEFLIPLGAITGLGATTAVNELNENVNVANERIEVLRNRILNLKEAISQLVQGNVPLLDGLLNIFGALTSVSSEFFGVGVSAEEAIDAIQIGLASLALGFYKIFTTITGYIKGFVDNWITFIESFINIALSGINKVIDALNTISIDIPEWVPEIGGNSFGVNLSRIESINLPRVSTGTVVPFNTNNTDQPTFPGQEVDEDTIRRIVRDESNREVTINFEGNLSEFARIIKPAIEEENRRTGQTLRLVSV